MRRWNRLIWFAGSVLLIGTSAAGQVPDMPGWRLVWHDEFSGNAVDAEKWEVLTRQNSFNNEKQYYLPPQASVADGMLRITASNEPIANKQYRSARLESWDTFGPGRFEARIDLPTTQGMWPAFWLFPNRNVDWPLGGEIDILENRGSQPTVVSSAYHWPAQPGVCCSSQYAAKEYAASENGAPVSFHAGFHTYAVEWDETQLRFYVDDVLHFTVNETASRPIFETPKNIILNLAVGGDFGGDPNATTSFPQFMDVDYVRVWQRATAMPGDYNADLRVDAADYVVWRETFGQTDIGLAADGSGNGIVDEADYNIWRTNFRTDMPSAYENANPSAVPEPASVLAAAAAMLTTWLIPMQRLLLSSHRSSVAPTSEAVPGAGFQPLPARQRRIGPSGN